MKTLIKSIFVASILVSAYSCSDDDEAPGATGTTAGATVRLADSEITIFDVNKELTLNLSGEDQISSISIIKEGQDFEDGETFSEDESIGSATVSGEVATFNSSALLPFTFPGKEEGDTKSTGSFDLDITYEGATISPAVVRQTIAVGNVVAVTQEVASVIVNDTMTSTIKFNAATAGATINNFVVTVSDQDGVLLDDISNEFELDDNAVSDSIVITRGTYITDYAQTKGDTLTYSFTASSGALSQTVETKVAIVPQPLGEATDGSLKNADTENQFNLLTGATSIDDAFSGDIDFVGAQGFGAINNTVDGETYTVDIQFVKLSITGEEDYLDYNDVEQAKVDFDAGAASSSVQVQNGDIYVYKVVRNVGTEEDPVLKDFYGAILVGDVVVTNAGPNADIEISLSARESSIIE